MRAILGHLQFHVFFYMQSSSCNILHSSLRRHKVRTTRKTTSTGSVLQMWRTRVQMPAPVLFSILPQLSEVAGATVGAVKRQTRPSREGRREKSQHCCVASNNRPPGTTASKLRSCSLQGVSAQGAGACCAARSTQDPARRCKSSERGGKVAARPRRCHDGISQ